MSEVELNRQEKTLEAGFLAVADSSTRLVHKTDGPCWDDRKSYVPLQSITEGKAHGYKVCNKCASGEVDTFEK